MKVTSIGLDIAKQILELHGVDRRERVVLRKTLKRDRVLEYFAQLEPFLEPCIYLATADCATSIPSIKNSPWMRGAPHQGFSRHIRRIRSRISLSILGRPPRQPDFHRQYARKPCRCHRSTVSGLTMTTALRIDG